MSGASLEPEPGWFPVDAEERAGPPTSLEPAYELASEFHSGLAKVHDRDNPFSHSPEFRIRHQANQRERERYCETFLQRLNELEAALEPDGDRTAILVAKTAVRVQQAGFGQSERSVEERKHQLLAALEDAKASRLRGEVFQVMMSLGLLYFADPWWPETSEPLLEAEEWFKRALRYASNGWPQTDMPRVCFWLGMTLARREDRLPEAVLMYDLASRFRLEFRSLLEKQKCRLRLGERDALIAETQPASDADIREIASGIAAAIALGRRRRRILNLADRGAQAAKEQGQSSWQRTFEGLWQKYGAGTTS